MKVELVTALKKNDWVMSEEGGLTLLRSPLLARESGLVHAFTTRLGGTSEPPLSSFNLGRHWPTESSRQDAMKNRSRLCAVLGLNVNRLVVPGQVHSTRVAWVAEPESLPDYDAVATVSADTPVLLHYADCVPIIIFDPNLRAVAVVHAGWRGTAGGIARLAVARIASVLGARPSRMVAAIGPAIGRCCYPVGADVADQLGASVGSAEGLLELREGIWRPDLQAINAMQLIQSGLESIDVCNICTACRPDLFYSHRASGGKTGRQGAIAGLA